MIEQLVGSRPASDVARWSEALDEIERHLDRSERLLGDVSETASEVFGSDEFRWTAPTDLGPLPIALQGRAVVLLDRLAQTERALSDQASLTARRMASVNRPDPRRKINSGSRFDSSC
ncbi:MAG: hypothetical protein AB7Q27_12980 [Acidimicrobiia bacterium]